MTDSTIADLLDLYQAEGILIGSGMESRPDIAKNPSFRHVLEGGTGLFTPHPQSMGYKRIMCTRQPPYRPTSAIAAMRVHNDEQELEASADSGDWGDGIQENHAHDSINDQ
jgi:hypothetical protein